MSWFNRKIKAGSLQFSILISIVIAVVISSFIILSYTQQRFSKQIEFAENAIAISNEAFNYLKNQDIPYNDSIQYDIEGDGSFVLHKKHWGIYDKVSSTGVHKVYKNHKIALMGGETPTQSRVAIQLDETNTPLVVVGDTRIMGNVILPSRGVKAGSIVGNHYKNEYLVNGSISTATSRRPSILTKKRSYLEQLVYGNIPSQDSLFIKSDNDSITSSFTTDPKWLYRKGIITLQDQVIKNNIIVKSDTLIRVTAFAKAENVLLIAPHIIVDTNVRGNFQAIASKSITVRDNVTLSYPSALVLFNKESTSDVSTNRRSQKDSLQGISIGSYSKIDGSIIQIGTSGSRYQKAAVKIAENTIVRGEIHTDQILELLGTVKGSVYVHQFETGVEGSIYRNHLYNTTIDTRNFPEVFCGITSDITQQNIAQWVY